MKSTASHGSGTLSYFKNNTPQIVKRVLKVPYLFILDIKHYVQNGFSSGIPAPSISNMEPGSYKEIGTEFFEYFTAYTDVTPSDKVLDVGCGWGRLGLPFTKFLSPEGEYHGFEIIENRVRWAQKNISSRHPNFHFKLVDVKNFIYSEEGVSATSFKFPYDDNSFDLVFLNSVFTHMLPQDVDHYLSEIKRVLAPGGKCLITYFLLNKEALGLIENSKSLIDFKFEMNGYMTNDQVNPEEAIAFKEDYILDLYKKHGISIDKPIKYGSWCQRDSSLSFQDIIVGTN
jgi:ubiquinone/menaquinone biosynthesis C-methylase UbiE